MVHYMPISIDNEWTIVDPTTTRSNTMASTTSIASAPATESQTEIPIDTKPALDEKKETTECTCDASRPRLARQESNESINSIDDDCRRPRRAARPNYIRRYSVSPVRIRQPSARDTTSVITSSSQLLDKVSKYDGIADLPFPARGGGVYLATFPFTDRDVKKWSWLFSAGIEGTFFVQGGRGGSRMGDVDLDDFEDAAIPSVWPVRRGGGRNRSPFYDPGTSDVPSVYLSRALDTSVVPEELNGKLAFLIVTQNRHRPAGSKLLVAEGRKAAGMLMYYELLKGDSVMFVGAVLQRGKKNVRPDKFKKVDSFEEAVKAQEEGFVGVIC